VATAKTAKPTGSSLTGSTNPHSDLTYGRVRAKAQDAADTRHAGRVLGKGVVDFPNRKAANALFVRANALVTQQQCKLAISAYDEAIQLVPDFELTLIDRGLAWAVLEQPARAIEDLDQAILVNQFNSISHYARGNLLASTGEYEASIRAHNNAITQDARNADFLISRGEVEFNLSRFGVALESFKSGSLLDHTKTPQMQLGMAQILLSHYKEALLDPSKVPKGNPAKNYLPLWKYLALARSESYEVALTAIKGQVSEITETDRPASLLNFYLERLDAQMVLKSAADLDPEKQTANCTSIVFTWGPCI